MYNFNQNVGGPTTIDCRYAVMPTCADPHVDVSQGAAIPALGIFYIRQRDTLDFGIDFTDWLVANAAGSNALKIASATWAVATTSPATPTIAGQGFDSEGRTSVTITPASGATAGDAYWLDLTMTTTVITATSGYPAVPARTIVRRIKIVVVNG